MAITYKAGSGSEAKLWNLMPDSPVARKDAQVDPSSNANTLRISLTEGLNVWSGITSGQFQYQAGSNLLGSVTGTFTQIAQFKNGAPNATWVFENPVDMAKWTGINNQAAFAYEREVMNRGLTAFGSEIQNQPDLVWGGFNKDVFVGYGDMSAPNGMYGRDWFFGDAGIDTSVYRGKLNDYSLIASNSIPDFRTSTNLENLNGRVVTDTITGRDGSDYLIGVERLKFSDISLALDVGPTQNAGSVYMLYKAAFNRPSDAGGMGYWISLKDGGADIVTNIAQGFVNSAEFTAKYGANPTNASYVNNLYQNVLGRAGEAGGVAYWTGEMDAGRTSKAEALVQFATLPEGAGIVAPLIANGIQYQEWVG